MIVKNFRTTGNLASAKFPSSFSHYNSLGFCVVKDDIPPNESSQSQQSFKESRIKEVIDYLNEQTGSHRKPTTISTIALLDKLFEKDYTVEDIKAVIRHKAYQWKNIDAMRRYLRPLTLFDIKNFRGYLAETKTKEL